MPILIKTDSDDATSRWEAMVTATYARQAELQELLQSGSSELIPPDPSLEEQHVVYAREVRIGSGPIDLVGIGSSGSITLMECKLARNRQIRREVVGQVLDYAASLWEKDVVSLVHGFRAASGRDPFEALRERFGSELEAFDEDACRQEVARRLRVGEFRLLVAVDEIDGSLRRIIQYVNRRGGPGPGLKLVALEFKRFQSGTTQVLVPESWGDEAPAEAPLPGELTDLQRSYLDFWTQFQDYLAERPTLLKFRKPSPGSIAVSKADPSGLGFRAWMLLGEGGAGVEIVPRTPEATRRFAVVPRALAEERLRNLGEVDWRSEAPRLQVMRDGTREEAGNRELWPATMAWMVDVLDELWSLFAATRSADNRDG